ncbi:hypothetical protein ACT8ZV_03720 [Nocardioides sp. MAHUQ-72]|uniref:hypothetical protein n=1 Tax=unclassified Nocardioides TaxID=2615069 RepID=UPI00362073AA
MVAALAQAHGPRALRAFLLSRLDDEDQTARELLERDELSPVLRRVLEHALQNAAARRLEVLSHTSREHGDRMCHTLLTLAASYATHPEFRREWIALGRGRPG